jgi:hypothetical protein
MTGMTPLLLLMSRQAVPGACGGACGGAGGVLVFIKIYNIIYNNNNIIYITQL